MIAIEKLFAIVNLYGYCEIPSNFLLGLRVYSLVETGDHPAIVRH